MTIFSKSMAACALAAIAFVPQSAIAAEDTAVVEAEQVQKAKKPKKITDRRHPDYVRCRTEPVMGSLARKKRVCMTNREWAAHNQEGNRRSQEFVDDMQVGMNGSN